MAGTGPDSNGPYAHEKPTKTGNVVGTPKPAIPRFELHVSTDVLRSDDGAVGLGRSRALVTIEGKVLLTGVDLSPVQVELVTLLAHAPHMARLLSRIASQLRRGWVAATDMDAVADLVAQLPFEVTP